MTQNLLIASEPDQRAENAATAERIQDARSLIDHLNSALSVNAKGLQPLSSEDTLSATEQSGREASSFANAIMRQADQIQYLIDKIDRQDGEAELAKLREVVVDLYRALTDVTMQVKQNTFEMGGKVSLLMEAMTILGGAADNINAPDNIALILAAAKSASERLGSLERLSIKTGASIIAMEDRESLGQNKIEDLSADLTKLRENLDSERKDIAGLHQRIDLADQALAERLAALGADIKSDRGEISGLHQRVELADQTLTRGLVALGGDIRADRGEISGLHQRIELTDQALTRGLAALGGDIKADRGEIAGLHQRIELADQAFTQGLAVLGGDIKADRREIAGLHQRVGSADQILAQGLAKLGECTACLRDDLEQMSERLVWVEKSAVLHAAFENKIDVLSRRLEEMELNSAAEIKSWWLQESERNAALINRLETLEQKNHSLIHAIEQMAARQNATEQTIATMIQRQKAQSALHDRVAHLLLARPEPSV